LETDKRVAEFTFIDWKGGPESIRKQKLFKDFYCLAEADTRKQRYLYVIGDVHAQKSFLSRSTCKQMLRKFADLQHQFCSVYDPEMTVREYFEVKGPMIRVINLTGESEAIASAYK